MANLYARLNPDSKPQVTRRASQTVDATLETWQEKLYLVLDKDGKWELRKGRKCESAWELEVVTEGTLRT